MQFLSRRNTRSTDCRTVIRCEMTQEHLKHNSPYLYVRLKRLKKGYDVYAKMGPFWRKVGHFEKENEAVQRLVDIAELNR